MLNHSFYQIWFKWNLVRLNVVSTCLIEECLSPCLKTFSRVSWNAFVSLCDSLEFARKSVSYHFCVLLLSVYSYVWHYRSALLMEMNMLFYENKLWLQREEVRMYSLGLYIVWYLVNSAVDSVIQISGFFFFITILSAL